MKKLIALMCVLVLVVTLSSCGENKSITLQDIEAAIQKEDPNFSFSEEDKPFFTMIYASDGWISYFKETHPVKVYKYTEEANYKRAVKEYEFMKDYPKIGEFVLECNEPAVQSAFDSLK